MPKGFQRVSYHAMDKDADEVPSVSDVGELASISGAPGPTTRSDFFQSFEGDARYYLSQVLQRDERPAVRGVTAPESTELVPDMRKIGEQDVPHTETRVVHFEQTQKSIPVFGSRIVVELSQNRELVDVTGDIAEIRDISPIAAYTPSQALGKIAELAQVDAEALALEVEAPGLTFFHDDDSDSWHLAYYFERVPAAPPHFSAAASDRQSHGHGMGPSPRQLEPELDYLVDAHDGTVLFYFSSAPMMAMPSVCNGYDELGQARQFWGSQVSQGFAMHDPLRSLETYDLSFEDIKSSLPAAPIQKDTNDWEHSNKAGVSAHVNATRVYDFYNSVLMRKGVDGKGTPLVSVVNCTYQASGSSPVWRNAVWYKNKMWYGQYEDQNGDLHSYSRFLDVIAHELTHGVTDSTSDLVYRDQPGALNESFSDIFGIIISNWYEVGQDSDVGDWKWEIGPGLGSDGMPLRDMSDPTRTGDPDHMEDYLRTFNDSGGVHTNSNIHNKAAYNVLTAQDERGNRVFSARDVAVLYYYCLIRLSRQADFSDALQMLIDVAKVYWAGDSEQRDKKIAAIRGAYQAVGITD